MNPVVVLLAGMFLPLFWNPPWFGRMWIPLLWICVNGFLLGSPSVKKEIMTCVVGAAIWFTLPYGVFFILGIFDAKDLMPLAAPYIRIVNQGVFFVTLYVVCIKQMLAYNIFIYLREAKK